MLARRKLGAISDESNPGELDAVISPHNPENRARLARQDGYKAAEKTIIPGARCDRTLDIIQGHPDAVQVDCLMR